MHSIDHYRKEFISHLQNKVVTKEPNGLYDPIAYILGIGGKRLRPVLVLMTAEIFGSDYRKAMDAALAVEIFHNFSLVHDDIMDDAPLRRGKKTVHEKWDINTGILSGDAMLIMAYQFFENYENHVFKELAKVFSVTALQVCEGQQYDIDFETRDDVTIPEYLKMIAYKTAVLVAGAMRMGAIMANASEEEQNNIYEFGRNLGIAFQLQDDYLDAFGNPETFGKQVGGDIIENKKTFLFLKAMELATTEQQQELRHLFSIQPNDTSIKIKTAKQIFIASGAAELTQKEIEKYTQNAMNILLEMNIDLDKKKLLEIFALQLMQREM
ncbi:MAG: polyprenyl synthetase [Flavobacteriaceae bacterium]|nr:MAG: polyprenyl synthetase [Flavobacteriaceae bacterium]